MTKEQKQQLKKKILQAMKGGATEKQINKYIPHRMWQYRHTTQEERDMARALHETYVKNIFES